MGTYTCIGTDLWWFTAAILLRGLLMAAPGLIVIFATTYPRLHKAGVRISPWKIAAVLIVLFVLFVAGCFLTVPIEWTIPVGSVALAIWAVTCRRRYGKAFPIRPAHIVITAAMGPLFLLLMMVLHRNSITITNDTLSFAGTMGKGAIPRSGAKLEMAGNQAPFWATHWNTDIPREQLLKGKDNLFFEGSDIFWGPDGLIRGDALGRRINNWAAANTDNQIRLASR